MFNIFATICFLQLSSLPTVCISNGYIAIDFETKDECLLKRNMLVEQIDRDLKFRNVSMFLSCHEKITWEQTDV